jgi:hypothetical protein
LSKLSGLSGRQPCIYHSLYISSHQYIFSCRLFSVCFGLIVVFRSYFGMLRSYFGMLRSYFGMSRSYCDIFFLFQSFLILALALLAPAFFVISSLFEFRNLIILSNILVLSLQMRWKNQTAGFIYHMGLECG